ncbi:hypothetical protein F5J12DRAFT_784984 [Pisolithus orientalis]|uniref:uncharacterized protein n=1 Tax=Pisolithus orientalis TaxID=936130 RepID=UPI0022247FC7|nr:uncharacterized protein F5J12DRAFT_784984 [Pisolithus orientalis]KAI5998413.1 hypothetical protein F5J12DRAFT_784984 [Pisolithus orientalis]
MTDLDLRSHARLEEVERLWRVPWRTWPTDKFQMGVRCGFGGVTRCRWILNNAPTDDGGVLGEDDCLDDEYRYWSYVETHPAHVVLSQGSWQEAVDILHWSYTDWLLTHPQPIQLPFSQEECQEPLRLLNDLSQQSTLLSTCMVPHVLLHTTHWCQVNFRPHKPLPQDIIATHTSRQTPMLCMVVKILIGILCLGIPFLFMDQARYSGHFDVEGNASTQSHVPLFVISACTCLMYKAELPQGSAAVHHAAAAAHEGFVFLPKDRKKKLPKDQLNSWLCPTAEIQPADDLPCGFPEATTITAYDTFNSDAEDGGPEDFNLDEGMDNTDLEDLDSNAEQHRPQADVAELQVELHQTRKALFEANSQHSKWSRNPSSKSNSLMTHIEQDTKKYLLLYHFFIIQSLFPAALNPNTDRHDPAQWKSQDGKLKGALTELYEMIPADLHESMVTYKQFGSVFIQAHGQERSNVLKVIKDCAGTLFAPYNISPDLFTGKPACKKDNKACLALLKKDGVGEYTCFAPILVADPKQMVTGGFLKSPILVKVIHVLMFGKLILTENKCGWPPARGQKMGVLSVTEGLIAGACILYMLMSISYQGSIPIVT